MKNRFIMKNLCITLIATMLMSNSAFVLAESDADVQAVEYSENEIVQEMPDTQPVPEPEIPVEQQPTPEVSTPAPEVQEPEIQEPEKSEQDKEIPPTENVTPEETPAPEETPIPEETPAPEETPTPEETPIPEETPSPTPDENTEQKEEVKEESSDSEEKPEVSVTPTPSPTPTPELEEWVKKFIDRIKTLKELPEITVQQGGEVKAIRTEYDALSEEDKAKITNYQDFVEIENKYKAAKEKADKISLAESYPMNLHAGSPFDLSSLASVYHLTFSDDFASITYQIEAEYLEANEIKDGSDGRNVTTSSDKFLSRNWQDILAVYIFEAHKAGKTSYEMDSSCKDELARIFAEMNPILTDKKDSKKKAYAEYHIDKYIEEHELTEEDQAFLKKYVETNCKIYCASATAAKGFIRQSIGAGAAEERVDMLSAAYTLLGKVRYFWGGKSTAIGWDSRWGTPMTVVAEGSRTTGTLRYFGLDCSGFVTWAAINAFCNTGMESTMGVGTSSQWYTSYMVDESEAKPGDLVFQRGPEAESDNHVGIICGKTDNGDWLVVHCNGHYNTITIDEAYGAGFRYIRRPSLYPSQDTVDWLFSQNKIDPILEETTDTVEDQNIGNEGTDVSDEIIPDDVTSEDPDDTKKPAEVPEQSILPDYFFDEFNFEDLSTIGKEPDRSENNQTIEEDEEKEQAEEFIYELLFKEHADEMVMTQKTESELLDLFDFAFDFASDDAQSVVVDNEISLTKKKMVIIDSSSEFFVGPLKPEKIPTFGPEKKDDEIFFGPELPEQIRIQADENILAEEYEVN